MAHRVALALLLSFAVLPRPAHAQPPRNANALPAAAVAESLRVLDRLKSRVYFRTADTLAWHRLGRVAWALADRARNTDPKLRELDITRLRRLADTALRIAADLDRNNIGYRLDVGHFLLSADAPLTRSASRGQFERALTTARESDKPALLAHAALEYGRTFWWRYDVLANRHMFLHAFEAPRSVTDAMQPLAKSSEALQEFARRQAAIDAINPANPQDAELLKKLLDGTYTRMDMDRALAGGEGTAEASFANLPRGAFKDVRMLLEDYTYRLAPDVAGGADFERSYELFLEAYSADPTYPGAFRAAAMVYAERAMWSTLEQLAAGHIRKVPNDSLGWLALGLAAQRRDNSTLANIAFDSALARMDPIERRRLDSWARVLPPGRFTTGTDSSRDAAARAYWLLATPLWSDSGRQSRTEFLARVTFAELRWTVEQHQLSGVDSDRGDVHVRYGPPDRIIVLGPEASASNDITTFWLYKSGLIFAFRGMPTYMTARIPNQDYTMVQSLMQVQPVRWDNIAGPVTDSLSTVTARFRAGRDSVDVVVAAELPAPDSIGRTMSVAGTVQRSFWFVPVETNTPVGQSATLDTAGVYAWSRRVYPSSFIYRVEAFAPTATRAARASGVLDANTSAFPLSGFGISDLLVGTQVTSSSGARWRDVGVTASAGALRRGGDLAVVWENYDFAPRDGAAVYDVAISLTRTRSTGGQVVARLAGALASIASTEANEDRVTFTFSRSVAYRDAFADNVSIALGQTPSGSYTLTVTVTDRVSGRVATRVAGVVVRE